MDTYVQLLSFVVFFPAFGALALAFFPREKHDAMRWWSLAVTVITFLVTVWIAWPGGRTGQFDVEIASMQNAFSLEWIRPFNIYYFMGLDGISFPLVLLTTFICVLAMGASWNITKHVKAYCILYLLLEMGMLGVFMS